MATTTNYAWDTPDDTDLVKDGAAAIRTLGSSIDTTTKALNPSTTLGDIEYRSATANTNTRLGIGTTGQVLTVDGGVPSWATATSGGMTVIASGSLGSAGTTISSIPGTYKNLQLIIRNKKLSSNSRLDMRYNNNSGTVYRFTNYTNGTGAPDATALRLGDVNNTTSSDSFLVANIYDYANSTTWKIGSVQFMENQSTVTNAFTNTLENFFFSTTAITELNILPNAGTITGGTYILYGVS
jgi:hypothetical protein